MNSKHQTKTKNDPVDLPEPGPGKQNPEELDRQLDRALEDSMDASDPPATTRPDVHSPDEKKQRSDSKPADKQG